LLKVQINKKEINKINNQAANGFKSDDATPSKIDNAKQMNQVDIFLVSDDKLY